MLVRASPRNPEEESQSRVCVPVGLDNLQHVIGSKLGDQTLELWALFPSRVTQNVTDFGDQVWERVGG